jgi:signal transduction histidine kinase
VKFPLHAAFQLAERIRHSLIRLKTWEQDPQIIADVDALVAALEETKKKATPREKLPLRDLNIQCIFQPFDVIPVVERTLSLAQALGENRGISVRWVQRPSSPVFINGDEAYLSTALHAIFDNAVKYSFDTKEVRIFGKVQGSEFELRVSNFGVGIPPEEQFRLFEFGERAKIEDDYKGSKREGAGLGLAITYRIIQAHRGDLHLKSVPSKGGISHDNYLSHEVSAYIRLPICVTH